MFLRGRSNQGRISLVALLFLSAIPGILLIFDLLRFTRSVQFYSKRAQLGQQQVPDPVIPDEAIVVLTGDAVRIPKALELLRSRGSPLLIISGVGHGITLTELVNQQGDSTINIHESWKKILMESKSSSTIENAQEAAKILLKRQMKRIILVTSDYHVPRASSIFKKVFPHVDIVDYAVPSAFSSRASVISHKNIVGIWYFWIEYNKHLLYSLYLSHQLAPAEDLTKEPQTYPLQP